MIFYSEEKAINRDIDYHRTNYKNGDWVYGLVTKLYNELYDLPAEMTNVNGVSGIEVDYKTIGQYTGITGKNGKRIFEGDILKAEIWYEIGCYTCIELEQIQFLESKYRTAAYNRSHSAIKAVKYSD